MRKAHSYVRVCSLVFEFRATRCAVSHCRPTTHSARMQTQSVSQAATEVPVLQIWTDQSPQPRPVVLRKQENEPLHISFKFQTRLPGPCTLQAAMVRQLCTFRFCPTADSASASQGGHRSSGGTPQFWGARMQPELNLQSSSNSRLATGAQLAEFIELPDRAPSRLDSVFPQQRQPPQREVRGGRHRGETQQGRLLQAMGARLASGVRGGRLSPQLPGFEDDHLQLELNGLPGLRLDGDCNWSSNDFGGSSSRSGHSANRSDSSATAALCSDECQGALSQESRARGLPPAV